MPSLAMTSPTTSSRSSAASALLPISTVCCVDGVALGVELQAQYPVAEV